MNEGTQRTLARVNSASAIHTLAWAAATISGRASESLSAVARLIGRPTSLGSRGAFFSFTASASGDCGIAGAAAFSWLLRLRPESVGGIFAARADNHTRERRLVEPVAGNGHGWGEACSEDSDATGQVGDCVSMPLSSGQPLTSGKGALTGAYAPRTPDV